MGYYPASLFNGLANNGTWLSFGGEVDSTLANPCSTHDEMGSGRHASEGWTYAAFQRLLTNITDAAGATVQYNGAPEVDTAAANCPSNMYTVQTFMQSATNWDSYQYFGGPALDIAFAETRSLTCLYTGQGTGLGSRVYFLEGNGKVRELAWTGSGWIINNTPAVAAQNSPLTCLYTGQGTGLGSRVYYLDATAKGQIKELAWTGSGWIINKTPAVAAQNSPLTCLYTGQGTGLGSRVYYLASDESLLELAWSGNTWLVT
jgi:hypothetical protein